ncbi:MAG: tryptophan--tRNA ligase, partial [Planctomycetota bacterium]
STDSRPMEEAKDPDTDHLYQLYALFASPEQRQEVREIYLKGGFGYGDIKKRLADVADEFLNPLRAKRAELANDDVYVARALEQGAQRASQVAREVLHRVQKNCGLN